MLRTQRSANNKSNKHKKYSPIMFDFYNENKKGTIGNLIKFKGTRKLRRLGEE